MPKYRIVSPDGVAWEVNAPEGATEQDALAYVKGQYQATADKRAKAGQELKQDVVDTAMVPLIAAGRQGDKLVAGLQQAGLGANVAVREAVGAPNADQLRKLADLEQTQQDNDAIYAPLKEKHPFLAGAGEAAFLAGVPMGQPTAIGRIAAPAITSAVNELLSYGSPKERALAAGGKGLTAAVGGTGGEAVRTLIAPARSALSAAQQNAVSNAAKNIGYTPRASELTGNETLRRLEDAVARQPGGAGPMRDLIDQNDRAVARHLAKGIGEDADALTPDVFARASDRRGATYDALRAQADMPVVQPIFDSITRAESMLSKGDVTGPKREALDVIGRLKDQLYETKQFDGATYQAWTSDLASKARDLGKTNRTAAAALREVEKAMDSIARGPNAKAWEIADREHATQELLMRPFMVNEQTGIASTPRIASQVERQFGKNAKTGKMKGPVFDVAALGRALPPMREGSPTAGREAFGGLPGWMMAAPNYMAAKALTSEFGRDYLSKGLLGSPGVSRGAGGLLGRGSIPLSIAEIEALLLGYQ